MNDYMLSRQMLEAIRNHGCKCVTDIDSQLFGLPRDDRKCDLCVYVDVILANPKRRNSPYA